MTARACKRVFALLSEFLDEQLPAGDCRTLQRHLRTCQPCLAYLKTLRLTADACREYGAHVVPEMPPRARLAFAKLAKSLAVGRHNLAVPGRGKGSTRRVSSKAVKRDRAGRPAHTPVRSIRPLRSSRQKPA